jgi:hypothetical protein
MTSKDQVIADVIRMAMIASGQPAADLAASQGQKWAPDELIRDFDVLGFAAPFVVVMRRSDKVIGSLEFTGSPRVYFAFRKDEE